MKKNLGHDAIYDARELGIPRMLVLGLQHLFAMFGATVLVPILVSGYGLPLSIQTTLLFAGLGTLLFLLIFVLMTAMNLIQLAGDKKKIADRAK